jgi:hypothetical protein
MKLWRGGGAKFLLWPESQLLILIVLALSRERQLIFNSGRITDRRKVRANIANDYSACGGIWKKMDSPSARGQAHMPAKNTPQAIRACERSILTILLKCFWAFGRNFAGKFVRLEASFLPIPAINFQFK